MSASPSGVDRTLLACEAEGVFGSGRGSALDVWVVATTAGTEGLELVEELRRGRYPGRSQLRR